MVDDDDNKINHSTFKKAIKSLSSDMMQFINKTELDKLKEIENLLNSNKNIVYDDVLQDLLEKRYVFEYEDGMEKRIHPMIEKAEMFINYGRS